MEKQRRAREIWILVSITALIYLMGIGVTWGFISTANFQTFMVGYTIACAGLLGWSLNVTPRSVQRLASGLELQGRTIAKFTGQGCQARDEFDWIGKVISVEKGSGWDIAVIRIVKHNFSYGDSRNEEKQEFYRQAIIPGHIQEVDGVLIIHA